MRRIAAIYDVHGNLPALEAVLSEVRSSNVDQVVIGGDVVPGPMPVETLRCLRALDLPVSYVRGNGEIAVLAELTGEDSGYTLPEQALQVIRWTAQHLTEEHQAWLSEWPRSAALEVEGLGEVLFCHATPRHENEIFTRRTAEQRLLPVFRNLSASVVVCGHTHMQFDRQVGEVRVVNAGSVGMPFGSSEAKWLLLDSRVELRTTPYDLEQAAEEIKGTNYPQIEELLETLLRPRSEEEMLDLFEKAELS